MLSAHLLDQAQDLAPRIVALRRAIHAEPELGLETPLTLAKVRAELADLPLEWREGTTCSGAVATRTRCRCPRRRASRSLRPSPGGCTPADMTHTPRCWPARRGYYASGRTS